MSNIQVGDTVKVKGWRAVEKVCDVEVAFDRIYYHGWLKKTWISELCMKTGIIIQTDAIDGCILSIAGFNRKIIPLNTIVKVEL